MLNALIRTLRRARSKTKCRAVIYIALAEFLYEIDLKILLRKLGERLNFKILLNTFAY
jgi:hypothetical protein